MQFCNIQMLDSSEKCCIFAGMEFSIYPYDRLPEIISDNKELQQAVLQCGGIMKFMTEHINDPLDDDTPPLFAQYQNYVAHNYRWANRLNPRRQNWSVKDLQKRALNDDNHLIPELKSRFSLLRTLRRLTNVKSEVISMVSILTQEYLDFAWKENLRRQRPDIDTDLGTYNYVIEQFGFEYKALVRVPGLACRSINIALKEHHHEQMTETDIYYSFCIEEFHHHFFAPTIKDCLRRGLKKLLHGKNAIECRAVAMNMLQRVQWFSQHIYNDKVVEVLNNDSFTLEDKRWLRNIIEHYDRDCSNDELLFFYFGMLFADIGRLWEKQLRCYSDIELSELEKEANSIINTTSYVSQLSWKDEKQCFKTAVLRVMEKKKNDGEDFFKKPTQWKAVYRFAVDYGIMYDIGDPKEPDDKTTPQYAIFEKFAHELQLDDVDQIRIPFTKKAIDDISKKIFARYNTPHPWATEGISEARRAAFYVEMDDVYNELETEFNNILTQKEIFYRLSINS